MGLLASLGNSRILPALVLLGASCATGASAGAGDGRQVGSPAPEITVQRMSGKAVSVSSYRGQVLLLDVWASWCGPCKQELPMLDDIAARLRHKGVEVLAVSVDQERDNVVKFLGSRGRWALTIAHDPRGEIADRLQPEKMPTSYIIDREGIIRYVNYGFVPSDASTIERRLADLAGDGGGGGAGARGSKRH
jgi:thiol-disulfide isomerase/thioredoxin